jgi:CubicO group peptidase (beta-lactamase class C family)
MENALEVRRTLTLAGRQVAVEGSIDDRFAPVLDAFLDNYREDEEIGSATAVVVDGRMVVDLWAGSREPTLTQPWERDTILCMMSVTKGLAGITFNMLIDRGLVDPDAPVARYWPEFAQNGKEHVLVRHVLDHTAGLPVVTEKLWPGAVFENDAIVGALERQAPLWEPGTTAAYHIHTQGNLLGEIVRRVTGKRFREFFRDEVARPLKLDYQIGNLSPADMARCATLVPTVQGTLFERRNAEPETLLAKAFVQFPDEPIGTTLNSNGWRQGEVASANGHGAPRAVARFYGAIARGGELDGVRLMSRSTIDAFLVEQHNQTELMQQRPYHQGRGVLLNTPTSVWMGPNPRAFGHHGFGGSIGMGDADAGVGLCYGCNKMHTRPDNGPRARRIIEAVYEVLG